MKLFLSSTFRDLRDEREAVLLALARKQQAVLAMEHFLAEPSTPLETALQHLRQSDVMILVIGFKAGSLLPDDSGMTYTSAEYAEAIRLGIPVLAFIKVAKRRVRSKKGIWLNKERSRRKARVLDDFHADVERCSRDTFETADQLALAVIQSLENWESQGRPGARKTFTSAAEFFASKAPAASIPILDFTAPMQGREQEIDLLNSFLSSSSQSVCVVSGRGGIGKSKILHDWTKTVREREVLFLKDDPLWHVDSYKEIPAKPTLVILDDAHRSDSLPAVSQLFKEFRSRRNLKLLLSTRPGAVPQVTHALYRDLDPREILIVPELQELTREQARELARDILGPSFEFYADDLADVAGNTPLIIVAGGRLIASEQVGPAELTNLEHFRAAIFTRFLDELKLEGPRFAISPTKPLLDLVAAVGPVNSNDETFLTAAEKLLAHRRDEILSTLDELAATGIVTSRDRSVRILPDVLSDFILEDRCVGPSKVSTQYADQIYELFGFSRDLMRNLSELDWRLERAGYGLDLLSNIWTRIERDFLAGDEYVRHQIFAELSSAAIYQPDHVLKLVDVSLQNPVEKPEGRLSRFSAGQPYVIEAIPHLLAATAQHPEYIVRSVDFLWELSKEEGGRSSDSGRAKAVLKRLASYGRYVWPSFNFAMLLQAIRLTSFPDAFDREFTPFDLIGSLLEREGEFTEFSDNIVSFGGFGLNIAAIGVLRQNALQFLETCLDSGTEVKAVASARLLGSLLYGYLPRVGRRPGEAELEWQSAERLDAFSILSRRLQRPTTLPVRFQIYDEIRSGTGINCPEIVRDKAAAALSQIPRDPDLVVFDALCTGDNGLPILGEFNAETWERPLRDLAQQAHDQLMQPESAWERAATLIRQVEQAHNAKIELRGYQRLIFTFEPDCEFLCAVVDQLLSHRRSESLVTELASTLIVLHSAFLPEFHRKARLILESRSLATVRAASRSLRVYSDKATKEDVGQIKAYLTYPDSWVKCCALDAIAYMGKNVGLRADLLDAALSVQVGQEEHVATSLAGAFEMYGVPISMLTTPLTHRLLEQFSQIEDLDADQGGIPRFLTRLSAVHPEPVLDLLLSRIAIGSKARRSGNWRYRTLNLVHGDVSFGALESSVRSMLGRKALAAYLVAEEDQDEYGRLFWMVVGGDEGSLSLLVSACSEKPNCTKQIATLIAKSSRRLAFDHPNFAKALLAQCSNPDQEEVIDAFVQDALTLPSGPLAGDPGRFLAQHRETIGKRVESMSSDGELAGLSNALKRSIGQ
jgi:hypothetical protein